MALKEEKVYVTTEKEKGSVRRETSAVSGMRVTIVHKNQNRSRHIFQTILLTRSMCVEEKKYPRAKVILVSFFDNSADTIWRVLARVRFVSIGTPECQLYKTKSVSIPAPQGWWATK